MKRNVRIGVIGTGIIGKSHIETYQKINAEISEQVGGVEVVAIANINREEADQIGRQFAIPHVYYSAQEMLKREDIDAVDVCLHNNLHLPATLAAFNAGKHVYCEKPMAGSYADALSMMQAAQKTGLKFSIQLSTLFTPETQAARLLIDEGKLGKIYHARSTGYRRRGRPYVDGYGRMQFVQKEVASGGALYDMGVYHIANMLYLLGNPEVQRITGKTYQETEIDAGRKTASGYNVEELGMGFVRFEKNITMDILESWAIHLNSFEGSSLAGSQGGIRLEPFGYYQNVGDLELSCTADLEIFIQRLHDLRPNAFAYDSPQAHWVAALHDRVPLLPTADLALNTMLISEGIYLSESLGHEVSAEEVRQHSHSSAIIL